MIKSPIHRWLVFEDSWPPSTVEYLLHFIKPRSEEIVYDPFVGCGTTPVVCAEHGLSTYSSDISTLAILTTKVKLASWSASALDKIELVIKNLGVNKLFQDFVNKTLEKNYPDYSIELIQFVLAAILLRTGWHKGVTVNATDLQIPALNLLKEIRTDLSFRSQTDLSHHISCSDFYAIDPQELLSLAGGNLVLVSSPPFFGSNTNPAKQRIVDLIEVPNEIQYRACPPKSRVSSKFPLIIGNISTDSSYYNLVLDYLVFLNRIVEHVAQLSCRAVALEMGPKKIDGELLRFDLILAELLIRYGYQITLFQTELESEEITLICAESL